MTNESDEGAPAEEAPSETPPDDAAPPPEGPLPPRRLTRSRTERVLGGVAGGLGGYLGLDPVLIRIVWVALVLFGGTGILLYIIGWVIIPEEEPGAEQVRIERGAPSTHASAGTSGALILAVVLIAVGSIALLRSIDINVPSWQIVLSGVLALVGAGLIAQAPRGLNGGLVATGIIVSVILAGAGSTRFSIDIDADNAFSDHSESPSSAVALERSYSHAFGSFTLDLGDLDLSTLRPGTTDIEIDAAFGSVEIRHGGLPVRVEASSIFGSGEDYQSPDYDDAERRILIDVSTAFGSSEVRR